MAEEKKKSRRIIIKEAGKRLREFRLALQYDRSRMAGIMGVTVNTYGKNETGYSLPHINSLQILHTHYKVSMDWLMFGTGPMYYETKIEESRLQAESEKLEKEKEEFKRKVESFDKNAVKFNQLESVIPDLTDLVDHMSEDPEFRYKFLLDFYQYKKEKNKE